MKKTRKKNKVRDLQLEEFEKRDLGGMLKKMGQGAVIEPKLGRQKLTSIYLDPLLISKLKEKALQRGMRYQSLLKMIVYEHLKEY